MNSQNVTVALIIAASLLISASIVSAGLKSFGRSVEHSASTICNGLTSQQTTTVPSAFRLDLGEIKIVNGGDGGQYFRVETRGN